MNSTTRDATAAAAGVDDDPYSIRLFEEGDRAGYLDLYDQVLGEASEAWFDWKYADNPYLDHVPTVVAEHEGTVVGAKSGLALRVGIADRRELAIQPCDTMVHSDHRRRGIFSRMTEFMKAYYRERDPALFFNFPNEMTLAGGLKHGWSEVRDVATQYRIRDPAWRVPDDVGQVGRLAARLVARAYLGTVDLVASDPSGPVVERHESIPVERLAALYERTVPPGYHTVRDETFYRWRFDNPHWTYEAYTVEQDGETVVAAVVGHDGGPTILLTDVLPLSTDEAPRAAYEALLARIVADAQYEDAIATMAGAIPAAVARRFGFLSDGSIPLSWVTGDTVLVAYPLTDDLEDLFDADAWHVRFSDMDTR